MKKEIEKTSILDRWKNREKKESEPRVISKAPKDVDFPLSRGQQRLFFLDKLYPGNPVYNSSEIYTFKGRLNIENLERSLHLIFATNDALRCSFHFVNGKAVQRVNNKIDLKVSKFDLSSLSKTEKKERQEQIMTEDSLKPFELSNPPLIRASLLKLDNEEHILFITVHHIVTDKWSMGIFNEQLAKYYKNAPLPEELNVGESKIQFTDYAYWERDKGISTRQLDYWKEKLSGDIPLLDLPTDYPQPVKPSFTGGSDVQYLSKDLSEKVLKLCKKCETTPYVVLLSVYYLLLYRYTNQEDLLIGSPISVRGSKALEDVIGFFDETIVLRTNLSGEISFVELVRKVRETVLDAFKNKDVPFDVLVKELRPERSIGHNPFFRTMFIYHPVPSQPSFDSEIDVSYTFYNTGISKFDLTLYIANEDGLLYTEFEYSKDLFDTASIARFQEHFRLLLEGVTTDPSRSIVEIPMLTTEELHLRQPKNLAPEGPFEHFTSIHEIIVEQALKNPDGIALVFGNESMTYREFNEESDLVAKKVLAFSKCENQIVGLCLERSIGMMVGLLGILKAGCAYLPIDLNYPSKRIAYILQDSEVEILLTQKKLTSNFNDFEGNQLMMDDLDFGDSKPIIDLPLVKKDDLAYVIYTSGSTGKPKGVPITHANIISSTEARLLFYQNNPKAFLLMSSISFDSSKAGVFWTLCTGGALVISEERLEQDIEKLSKVIAVNSVSHTLMLPSLYKMVLEYSDISNLRSLNTVMVAGEECTSALCKVHFEKLPETVLYNEYGPTEATVWCIAHKIEKDDDNSAVPIGKPISNTEVYLLNPSQEVVPYGAIGEIYIGGSGLSGQYMNRPELTRSSYIAHPFRENDILYRTGDLGRFRNDGTIAFLGRKDQQVKIRGFRIELEEIEKALMNNPAVQKAVVMAEVFGANVVSGDSSGPKRLVAYVVTKEPIDTKALQKELMTEIPSYMVPSNIMDIDKFPELPNGKINKKLLREFGESVRAQTVKNSDAPTNEVEAGLVKIWEEVLNFSPVGIKDNYFEIGGDSMTSIRMFWLIEKNMKANLSPNVLFTHPTIEAIARKISGDKSDRSKDFDHVVPFRPDGKKNPLFCVHGGEGHILFYQNFAKYIASDRPVYLVQPKGANGDKELHTSIEQMAREYLEEIVQVPQEGPFNLLFYCCGPLVIEMSNQLRALGKTANIIIVDSSPKYIENNDSLKRIDRYRYYLKRMLKYPLTTIKKSILYRYRRYAFPLYVSLLNDRFLERQLKIRDQLEKVQSDYEWMEFEAQCTLIIGEDGLVEFDEKDIFGWNHWCTAEIKVLYSPGNHFNIFDEPQVRSLGKNVERACR